MSIRIMKFGGSSFQSPADYRKIAYFVAQRSRENHKPIVVVVSAMCGETNRLRDLACATADAPCPIAMDALICSGENASAQLLKIALIDLGLKISILDGCSVGIHTDGEHGNAAVTRVDPSPLRRSLSHSEVVVVAGAQGLSSSGHVAFLGRNSSDLSAVVIAAALSATSCEIYSDVAGIFTADPTLIADARICPEISFDRLLRMARLGAKVMCHRAVAYASQHRVEIKFRSWKRPHEAGTRVCGNANPDVIVIDRLGKYLGLDTKSKASVVAILDRYLIPHADIQQGDTTGIYLTNDTWHAARKLQEAAFHLAAAANRPLVSRLMKTDEELYVARDIDDAVQVAYSWHRAFEPALTKDLGKSAPREGGHSCDMVVGANR